MSEKWFYINSRNEKVGPVASRALKTLAETGALEPSMTIIASSTGKMYKAGDIRGLFQNNEDPFSSGIFLENVAQTPPLDWETEEEILKRRTLTPLPSKQTLPLTYSQAAAKPAMPTPPPKPLPLTPFESGVPTPFSLKSTGATIAAPKRSFFRSDNILIWLVLGITVLFAFGGILVGMTWRIAARQMSELAQKHPSYEGMEEQNVPLPDGRNISVLVRGDARSSEEIAALAEPSIALISGAASCGTGFVVAPGLLATNCHVISADPIDSLEILFPSAEPSAQGPYKPRLYYEDPERDIALLAIDSDAPPPLPIVKNYRFRRAQQVITIGNPGRGDGVILKNAVSAGILSTQTEVDGLPYYQLNIAINHGNSGGPVLDDSGKVIGIITLKATRNPSMAYCIPAEDFDVVARPGPSLERRGPGSNSPGTPGDGRTSSG